MVPLTLWRSIVESWPRRTRVVVIVVLGTLALALAWGTFAVYAHLVQTRVDREATARSVGEVTGVDVGGLGRVAVTWRDRDDNAHAQVFSGGAGQSVYPGAPFTVRYDPADPDQSLAGDGSDGGTAFDLAMVPLIAGVLVLLCWVARLVRWRWGVGRGEVGFATAQVEAVATKKSVRVWVRLSDEQGLTRYQRVVWEPWLEFIARGQQVAIKACPGFGESFIIEVPGRGRLWPAGPADEEAPGGVERFRLRRDPGQTVLAYVALGLFDLTFTGLFRSPFVLLFLPLVAFAAWQWFGYAPPGLKLWRV
jgi:hypothetical protein